MKFGLNPAILELHVMRIIGSVYLFCLYLLPLSAVDWRPVEASELSRKTPKVDPAADAEAIFWDVRIEDKLQGGDLSMALVHYIRVKIYTERGKEQWATVEIPRAGKRLIGDVAARTIKANGTIIDVKKDSIFDRELVKTKGFKARGIAFALPNIEVGDIVEYRYRETRGNEIASYMRLYFQRELPMWEVSYHLKPLSIPWLPWQMRGMSFQIELPPIVKEMNGFVRLTQNDVPAFRPEPNMPPEDQLKAWVLIYYEEDKKIVAEKYWKEVGKQDYNSFKSHIKADGAVKKAAGELITGAANPEEELYALDHFCRSKIKNLSDSSTEITSSERKSLKENHSPSDTLKQMAGYGQDIDLLFAALASAAGFDARMARVPDRGDTFFDAQRPTKYFIGHFSVAVKRGEKWAFFDPSTNYLEHGMLRWQEEGQNALVSDPKEGFFVKTQFSEPARSLKKRLADLRLSDDGTLEGTITYTYTGHVAQYQKHYYSKMTPAQQEEDWKESTVARLSTAEISDFTIENVTDPLKPMVVRHKISVPGYGTRTGKRILLHPAFFQMNVGPRFTEATRKHPVYFDYAWAESDEVNIELPQGWLLDKPTALVNSKIGETGNYEAKLFKTTDERSITYKRQFDWGRNMNILTPINFYDSLKKVFYFVQEQDSYTLSLKQEASGHATK